MVGAGKAVESSVVQIIDSGVLNEETDNEEDEEEDDYRLQAKERGYLRNPDEE